jgi:hypothetical protein
MVWAEQLFASEERPPTMELVKSGEVNKRNYKNCLGSLS